MSGSGSYDNSTRKTLLSTYKQQPADCTVFCLRDRYHRASAEAYFCDFLLQTTTQPSLLGQARPPAIRATLAAAPQKEGGGPGRKINENIKEQTTGPCTVYGDVCCVLSSPRIGGSAHYRL
ncbi:hypothetical protein CDAR_409031 [Caerostris darwini]|uniref:Uncharacterized protein n=1 Tax=Caerostris darwini TaxID=1538125 RepID=A0AAV4PEF6_9ARAC|nr:hypothetical protein CDAR_409031 [Caerostris darwini]